MSRHFDANMLKRIGIAHYLHKPVAQRELHQVIAGILVPHAGGGDSASPHCGTGQRAGRAASCWPRTIWLIEGRQTAAGTGHHRCEVVNNGREALARWRADCWDLLLIDLQMPEMDGETAIRLLREETQALGREHQPAMAMTAHAMQGDRERCLAMGFDGYIAKPVSQEALREAIARVGARKIAVRRRGRPAGRGPPAETVRRRSWAGRGAGGSSLLGLTLPPPPLPRH